MSADGGAGSKKRPAEGEPEKGGGSGLVVRIKPPKQKARDEEEDMYDEGEEGDEDGASDDDEEEKDWTDLIAKADHANRPIYVGKNRHAFLERFSPFFKYAEELLISIAEPVSRCKHINEYVLTQVCRLFNFHT
jgi:hypothetical protein